ncbi:acetyl-CoA synthetase-like protein [Ramaria rubella]|nr:acetyl-CoA synthetase-like protein [Ramaria rubella]
MAASEYTAPPLYDTPVPDVFARIAAENPARDFVQVLHEHAEERIEAVRYTWSQVLQSASNAALDLRVRWAARLDDAAARRAAAQPRGAGAALVVVAILTAPGYEQYVNMLACILNRYTVQLISPRIAPHSIEHLLRTADAALLLADDSTAALALQLDQNLPALTVLPMSPVAGLAPALAAPAPPTPAQLPAEMASPVFYMHTSGSTDHPKLIPWTHAFFLAAARARQREGPHATGRPWYNIAPITHAMGLFTYGMYVLAHAHLITFLAPGGPPPSATTLRRHLPFIARGYVAAPPSVVEGLYALGPDAVAAAARTLEGLVYAGAALKRDVGDALVAAGVRLVTAYGLTELNVLSKVDVHRPEDWEYITFRDGYDLHWLPAISGDGNDGGGGAGALKTLVVAPGPEDTPAVFNHDNPRGYATNDIWAPHPSLPNTWRFHSRMDDITVLSTGAKTSNKQLTDLLLQDPRIHHVLVFGTSRPLNGVLIQLHDDAPNPHSHPNATTPLPPPLFTPSELAALNTRLPLWSRLVPELVLVAPPGRRFAVSDKRTVKRGETLAMWGEEIEEAYGRLGKGVGEGVGVSLGVGAGAGADVGVGEEASEKRVEGDEERRKARVVAA